MAVGSQWHALATIFQEKRGVAFLFSLTSLLDKRNIFFKCSKIQYCAVLCKV